jgi:hypothetical protein
MKKLRFLVVLLIAVLVNSCYEVNEEIVINPNGSGTYATHMDMSALIDMMQTLAGDDELSKEGLDRALDTTIQLKNMIDSAKDLTATQKELMQNGTMHMAMNLKEKIFQADMNFKFKDYTQLQSLISGAGTGGIANVFKTVFEKSDSSAAALDAPKDPGLDDLGSVYDVTVKDGFISKKINEQKLKAILDRPEMAQMKEVSGQGIEIMYTTVMKLPRPVKKTDNALLKLSDDKKTVTIKYNLLEILDTPDKFSYVIEY